MADAGRGGADGGDGAEPFEPTWDTYEEFELLDQARANAQAAIIATVAWLGERGVAPAEWAVGLGQRFDRAWGEPELWDANTFLDAMLTNLQALGAEVVQAELADPTVATATLAGLFDEGQCLLFGTTRAAALSYLDATAGIATPRGLVWEWESDGDDVLLKVRGAGTASTDAPHHLPTTGTGVAG